MRLEFDAALPISGRRDDIANAISDHQVVVVAGETGSGKTTQLPKIAASLGRTRIAHTQPRRIAARSVARRIADECDVELGREVGYAVRFDDRSNADTQIKLVTDGLLLAELASDRTLSRYDTIIIDEAHERSLAIDFLLGYLKRLLPRRPELKVIVTSATIDVDRFAEMFDAPVIEVSGRTYPVEIRYRPDAEIAEAIAELPRDGDILVFCSGEREIRDAADELEGKKYPATEILPLYGRLAAHEQQRIFETHRGRRIVLATNVAETSLTVPGIRYVIDPGYARISRFSTRLKVQRLPIEPVSQASAAQRAGRCGRVADGICIRLYSEEDFDGRPEFTDPEILRTNLAAVLLQMAALDLGDIADFPFLDAPDGRAVADGLNLLRELGALDGERLTRLGRSMGQLPVDPRMGRMLLAADKGGCLADVLVIVAAMSIQDPRERPLDTQQQADAAHRRFIQPDSDFLSYLKLWEYLHQRRRDLSHSKFRRMCHDEYLHYLRVREWSDVHGQLRQTAREMGMKPGNVGADSDAIHRALLTGLISHVGLRDGDTKDFLGARNSRFMVFPGSGLARKPPRWVMAGELVETSRLWARDCARIQPEWVEKAADHLLKRQYAEPYWSSKRGQAMAKERATLYGIPVVVDRVIALAKVDPALARELFIRHALVEGQWQTRHRFWHQNRELITDVEQLEEKARTRGIRVDDQVLFDFYDARIPASIVSERHFDSWWKRRKDKHELDLRRDDIASMTVDPDDYPTTWTSQSNDYDVEYRFDPTAEDDGVTVTVPVDDLLTIDPDDFAWHVRGNRLDLVTELIRSLPKSERRRFAPAGDHAARILPALDTSAKLTDEVGRALDVDPGLLNITDLPDHLRVTFRVVDGTEELARGKDVEDLRHRLEPRLRRELQRKAKSHERTGITTWDVGTLDDSITAGQVTGYPALIDEGVSVALRVLPTRAEQQVAMVRGQARLMALGTANPVSRIGKSLTVADKLLLSTTPQGDAAAVIEECWLTALDTLVVQHGGPARNEADFDALRERVRQDVHDHTERNLAVVIRAISTLSRIDARGKDEASEDVRVQLSWLIYRGFVRDAGGAHLPRLPVYIEAARRRLTSTKDLSEIYDLEARFADLVADLRPLQRLAPPWSDARWALEELRVSVVAQDLRAAIPISTKRMTARLDELEEVSRLSRHRAGR